MPKAYEKMRDNFQKEGLSRDKAQSKAAAIFVSQGKNPKSRSKRAKSLQP